jgi:CCR4-NOT complex subunit CAF16
VEIRRDFEYVACVTAARPPVIQVRELSFRYRPDLPRVLDRVTLDLLFGERCLLVGANGAGKTTLLRLIGGKHMIDDQAVRVLGRPAFNDTSLAAEVAFLGGSFPFEVDVRVGRMLENTSAEPGRLERLRRILDVDPEWRMHSVSDGQRRRVQLLLGLLHPYRVLLLDEVTTDLDLLGRADLLEFLREESEVRGACIFYATHIFDRLETWATHLAYLREGRLVLKQRLGEIAGLRALKGRGVLSPLSHLVEGWLRDEQA